MTKKIDIRVNIQENSCVDGIIILLSSELYELIKEEGKTALKQTFDTIVENVEIEDNI